MKEEIKIILEDSASNKAKGNCFENLTRTLLEIHQYEVRNNINFAGMEIDLIAKHKHRNETLYVECKAKEKVSSDEISKFSFNVNHKKADAGYFFRTKDLESQAGALLNELKSDAEGRYKNLTFFEPCHIIQMLLDAKKMYEPLEELSTYSISKKILAITYLGDFFIYLVNKSEAFPTKFIIVNAQENKQNLLNDQVEEIKSKIDEIKSLEQIALFASSTVSKKDILHNSEMHLDVIAEVQESENWYDYLPASSEKKHFVGRDDIKKQIFDFFKDIQNINSSKRIFYLNGKSGWGKSSLVLEIKEKCNHKNTLYAIAIDTRSATSDNFVVLALKKLIKNAITSKFISNDIFFQDIQFTSNVDLLSSDSMLGLLEKLNEEKKYLVLIFDQFEDVFRKKDFFKSFYKFLTDVTDKKPNIIVGFSWKSDFFIQSDDPSYHIWQQAKEQAREFTINEFGEKEIDAIIKQLENSPEVGELDKTIKDRIKESSQGLPWLTKKLCIHIYDQIKTGLAKENLIESNLNIADLFKKDEESIEGNELKALRSIAKRAYEGNPFDATEVGDIIDSNTITALLNRRLIIRSGANYNIYWDIYRDYLATGVIPIIGESYLLRRAVNSCIDVFLLFESTTKKETISSLASKYTKGIEEETLRDILIELRNIGLVQKDNEYYTISKDIELSKEGFIKYITEKFQNYIPYLNLKKAIHNKNKITRDAILSILKTTFKQDLKDSTLRSYANILINWLAISNLDIKSKLTELQKGQGTIKPELEISNFENALPRSSLTEISEMLEFISDSSSVESKFYRDLQLIGIIDKNKNVTEFAKEIISKNYGEQIKMLKEKIILFPKMIQLQALFTENPKITAKDIVKQMPIDFFEGNKNSSKITYALKALSWLK